MTLQDSALPDGWRQAPLGHLCLVNPRSFVEAVDDDTEVSFVPMAAVEADTGILDPSLFKLYKEVSKGYTRFSEGDVLFAKITPCMENGKIAVANGLKNGAGCGSTEFHVLRSIGGLSEGFLMYFLLQEVFRREAQGNMTGSAGQLRVPAAFLEEAPFPLPPLAEQHRIVAEIEKQLTRLDASVAALRRAKANLKRYRASVLKAVCEGRLVPTEASLAHAQGHEYEHAGQLLQRILEERRARWESQEKRRGAYKEPSPPDTSALPDLPEGWAWAALGQLSMLKGGVTKGQRHHDDQMLVNVPYLRVANVQRGYLDLREIKSIDVPAETLEDLRLIEGDVLFTEGGDRDKLGRGWVWHDEIPDCIHQNHIFRSRLCLPEILPEFISWWGNSFGQDFFTQFGKQTTNLASINLALLTTFPVPLPPVAEQHRIVAEVERRLSVVQQAEATVDASLRRAERLRQSVLKRAFEGKLVPQDSDDEPASVLLERIRAEREAAEASRNVAGRRGRGRPSKRREEA